MIISASNLLNWSYQNTKACSVIVSENSDIFPASKATTLETNRSSVNNRPRPASAAAGTGATGGTIDEPKSHSIPLRRSRRQALQHAPSLSENLPSVEIVHDSQLVATSSKSLVAHDSIHVHDHSKAITSINQDASLFYLKSSTSSSTEIKLAPKLLESRFEPKKNPISTDDVDKDMVQDMAFFTINKGPDDQNMLKNDVPLKIDEDKLNSKLTIFPEKYLSSDKVFSASRKPTRGFKSKSINTTNDFAIANSKHSHDDNAVLPEVVPPSNDDENRVLVNVTISTGKTRPLYVLSISVPTNNSSGRMPDVKLTPVDAQHELYAPSESLKISDYASDAAYKETSTIKSLDTTTSITTTTVSADKMWGGECVCSCPTCMDNENDNITDTFFDDDDDNDVDIDELFDDDSEVQEAKLKIESILKSGTTQLNLTDYTSTEATVASSSTEDDSVTESVPYSSSEASSMSTDETTTESIDSTETLCPTMTTPLPQPPTILILEGKINFIHPFVWRLY